MRLNHCNIRYCILLVTNIANLRGSYSKIASQYRIGLNSETEFKIKIQTSDYEPFITRFKFSD